MINDYTFFCVLILSYISAASQDNIADDGFQLFDFATGGFPKQWICLGVKMHFRSQIVAPPPPSPSSWILGFGHQNRPISNG